MEHEYILCWQKGGVFNGMGGGGRKGPIIKMKTWPFIFFFTRCYVFYTNE